MCMWLLLHDRSSGVVVYSIGFALVNSNRIYYWYILLVYYMLYRANMDIRIQLPESIHKQRYGKG